MDARRLLSQAALGLALSGCAVLRPEPPPAAPAIPSAAPVEITALDEPPPVPVSPTERPYLDQAAVPARSATADRLGSRTGADPVSATSAGTPPAVPVPASELEAPSPTPAPRAAPESGRAAIAAANAGARAASQADAFVGGVQVFAYDPGRVYEVWTAPLRVTTLTLAPGETVTSKAAGDTVRWQIGEATSGAGSTRRTHVLLKPLERGLETNLVLTTSQRVYLLQLRSGPPDAFNAAVAWDIGAVIPPQEPASPAATDAFADTATAGPAGPPDARYRILPRGRAPRWTPSAVFNDGVRTFIAFAPDLHVEEAPALFLIAPDGEAQMVNYRQQGGLFVVDRLFDRAELRLGDRRPQIVRIERRSSAEGGRR